MGNEMSKATKDSLSTHLETIQTDVRSAAGPGMLQTKTQYSTAVQVIRPRNMQDIKRRCLEEASLMGDSCYYSWKQGGDIIEGLSVGAALMAVRNFGNCVVEARVEQDPDSYMFYASFVDLETGFNLVRPFRQRKESPKAKGGKEIYSGERGQDVIFQIGTSKAMRNAALNALPSWLKDEIMSKSKQNVTEKIKAMGIEKAKAKVKEKAAALGIDLERMEAEYGKEKAWDINSVVMISSTLRQIEDGFENADERFPKKAGTAEVESPATQTAEAQPVGEPKLPENFGEDKMAEIRELVAQCDTLNATTPVFGTAQKYFQEGLITQEQMDYVTTMLANKTKEINKKKGRE